MHPKFVGFGELGRLRALGRKNNCRRAILGSLFAKANDGEAFRRIRRLEALLAVQRLPCIHATDDESVVPIPADS